MLSARSTSSDLKRTRGKQQYSNTKRRHNVTQVSSQRGMQPKAEFYCKQKSLCWSHNVAAHLLFQELFTGFVEGAGFVRHKQILLLKGVQVLQGGADIFENGITLFLVAVQLISGFPEGGKGQQRPSKLVR